MKTYHFQLLLFGLLFSGCTSDFLKEFSDGEKEIVFNLPPGFELEELYNPMINEQGSWVALAEGEDGIFYAGDQNGDLYQFKVPPVGQVMDSIMVDSIDLEIGHANGLLWAFNSLYVSVNDRWEDNDGVQLTERGSGVYRLQDTNGDGALDDIQLLLKLEGAGEHGPHSLILGPEGKDIYFIAGNHTLIPEVIAENSRLPNNWGEDNLFPPFYDARGHANDVEAPGGWIARTDPEGKQWELIAAGFRNPFDMAFNQEGELFAFDADMEWDIGMPWYRPIRICHVSSGSDFGWRTGSGKWPTYYPDNLPPVVNLGQGSPTAVLMTYGLDLPPQYQNRMLVFDWSFGTAYLVNIEENGSSYTGSFEEFFSGTPLPLTDAVAGSDGALYFATGGRKLDSHLYRLRYTGTTPPDGKLTSSAGNGASRKLRRQLEAFHNSDVPADLSFIWENLNHDDRFIRYAARIALEHQAYSKWEKLYRSEKDPDRILQSTIALARIGADSAKSSLYRKLDLLTWNQLSERQQLDYLRALGLTAIRLGQPAGDQKTKIVHQLGAFFPSGNFAIDREISQLLVFFGDAATTAKCIQLLERHTREKTITHPALLSEEVSNRSEKYGPLILEVLENMPPTEAIFYGTLLSRTDAGWTDELREQYFSWFFDGLNSSGGMSFKPFLENIRKAAMTWVPDSLKAHYEKISGIYQPGEDLANLPQPEGPGKDYNPRDIGRILGDGLEDYLGNIATGKRIYQAALCSTCHRMRGEGGTSGPDLTQLHTRFKQMDLITAIFSPNDEISDQYAFTLFQLKEDKKIAGKIFSEAGDTLVLIPNPFDVTYTVKIPRSDIVSRGPSPVSPMPSNLLNRLNEAEITDLFAYLLSGADPEHYFYGGTKGLEDKEED